MVRSVRLELGTYEVAVHEKDLAFAKAALETLQAQGLIGPVTEIPKEKSFQYSAGRGTLTPHKK